MNLTRISDGAIVDVQLSDPTILTKGEQRGSKYVVKLLRLAPGSLLVPGTLNALQSWAYRNGYEPPEKIEEATTKTQDLRHTAAVLGRVLAEAKIRVRAYNRRSKKGRQVNVSSYERENIHDKVPVDSVIPISGRVWNRARVKLAKKYKLGIQLQGALGENIFLTFLKRNGHGDAELLSIDDPIAPFDIVYDHMLVEVKTGMVSNKKDSMKWAINFGQQKGKVAKRLKKMNASAKEAFYIRAFDAIIKSKANVVREYEKRTGKKIRVITAGLILNTKTQAADVYITQGVHKQIRWMYPHVTTKYSGTVRYK